MEFEALQGHVQNDRNFQIMAGGWGFQSDPTFWYRNNLVFLEKIEKMLFWVPDFINFWQEYIKDFQINEK